ncbi:MAG: outer membrane protein assembly factor BamE [bacterium]|nr:outer membrane protein assembly factor BamE [bacterium]
MKILKRYIPICFICVLLFSACGSQTSTDTPQLTDADLKRLDNLLNQKLVARVGNPEALEIKLAPKEKYDEQLLTDNDDRAFLEKHKARAIEMMLPRLDETGSTTAALVLGYFKEPKALAALKKWFIKSENFYGWETSFPDELSPNQYTHQHCYEEAITFITGKPLHEAISLSETEEKSLVERFHKNEGGSAAALYVLYRLKPGTASREFARHYRDTPKEDRFSPCLTMKGYFIKKGFSQAEVRELVGEPDSIKDQTWNYECGGGWVDPETKYFLTVTFDGDKVAGVEVGK